MSIPRTRLLGSLIVIAFAVAACSSGATSAPGSSGPATPAPGGYGYGGMTQAPATPAPATTPAAGGSTVEAKSVASVGNVLVAGSNGMTVYTYANDVANSGTSACTGACLVKWPALTIPAGSTPVAGAGVTGTLGTITRADDGTLQVTYNGLPLYFFAGDKAPGDTNGNYTGWSLVTP